MMAKMVSTHTLPSGRDLVHGKWLWMCRLLPLASVLVPSRRLARGKQRLSPQGC